MFQGALNEKNMYKISKMDSLFEVMNSSFHRPPPKNLWAQSRWNSSDSNSQYSELHMKKKWTYVHEAPAEIIGENYEKGGNT